MNKMTERDVVGAIKECFDLLPNLFDRLAEFRESAGDPFARQRASDNKTMLKGMRSLVIPENLEKELEEEDE